MISHLSEDRPEHDDIGSMIDDELSPRRVNLSSEEREKRRRALRILLDITDEQIDELGGLSE